MGRDCGLINCNQGPEQVGREEGDKRPSTTRGNRWSRSGWLAGWFLHRPVLALETSIKEEVEGRRVCCLSSSAKIYLPGQPPLQIVPFILVFKLLSLSFLSLLPLLFHSSSPLTWSAFLQASIVPKTFYIVFFLSLFLGRTPTILFLLSSVSLSLFITCISVLLHLLLFLFPLHIHTFLSESHNRFSPLFWSPLFLSLFQPPLLFPVCFVFSSSFRSVFQPHTPIPLFFSHPLLLYFVVPTFVAPHIAFHFYYFYYLPSLPWPIESLSFVSQPHTLLFHLLLLLYLQSPLLLTLILLIFQSYLSPNVLPSSNAQPNSRPSITTYPSFNK